MKRHELNRFRSMSISVLPLIQLSLAMIVVTSQAMAQPASPPRRAPRQQPDAAAMMLGLDVAETTPGILTVTNIRAEGLAAELDVRKGDVLLSMDGEPLTSKEDLTSRLATVQQGDKIALTLARKKKQISIAMIAPERPKVAAVNTNQGGDDVGMLGMMLAGSSRGRVLVTDVSPDTPASTAGLRKNDVLLSIDGYKVTTLDGLMEFAAKLVQRMQPGDELEIIALRENKEQPFTIVMPEDAAPPSDLAPPEVSPAEEMIVFCMAVREAAGERLAVLEVMPKSPAAVAGIEAGDIIETVAGEPIRTFNDLAAVIKLQAEGDKVEFGIMRGRDPIVTEVTMAPCEFVRSASSASRAPRQQADIEAMAEELRILRTQVEKLTVTVEELSIAVEELSRQ